MNREPGGTGNPEPEVCLGPAPSSVHSRTRWAVPSQLVPRPSVRSHTSEGQLWAALSEAAWGCAPSPRWSGCLRSLWSGSVTPGEEPQACLVSVLTVARLGCPWDALGMPEQLPPPGVTDEEGVHPANQDIVPKVSLLMGFITCVQPGILLLVSMATPHRPPLTSVAQGGSLTGVQVPASPQGWP